MLCFNHGLKHHASSNEHCGDVLAGDHGAFPPCKTSYWYAKALFQH